MDIVFLKDLKVMGRHGVLEHERRTEQEFLVDIEAGFDAKPAARSDALTDTIDYMLFVDIVNRVVAENSFYLIEKLANSIADEILADTRIAVVRVSIRKPAVLPSGVPGVTIERPRV